MRISKLIVFAATSLIASSAVFGEEGNFHIRETRSFQMYDYYFDEQGRTVEIPKSACLPEETNVTVPNAALHREMIGAIKNVAFNNCKNNPPTSEDKEKLERVFCFLVGDVEVEDGSASRYCFKNDQYERFTAFIRFTCECFGIPVEQETAVVQNSEVSNIFWSADIVGE
jgi:hypothetical protein